MPRRFPRPAESIPPEILPPDFLTRHDLVRRLYLDPMLCLTPAHAWAPMTDEEWRVLAPILAAEGCGVAEAPRAGRPMEDPRARLDAVFRAVTLKHPRRNRAPWRLLPEAFGKADTVSRTHRRWTRAGLWMRLLREVAAPGAPPVLAGLAWRVCCAFRRGIRIMGLGGILLARQLRLHSALPAPSAFLPDPDLSEILRGVTARTLSWQAAHPGWLPPRSLLRFMGGMMRLAFGRRRLSPGMEPA